MGELAQNKPTPIQNEIDKMQYFAHKIVSINRKYASQIHNGVYSVPVIVSNSFLLDKMEYNILCVRCVLIFINISRNELNVCCVCYYWMKRKKKSDGVNKTVEPDFLMKIA